VDRRHFLKTASTGFLGNLITGASVKEKNYWRDPVLSIWTYAGLKGYLERVYIINANW